MRTAAAVGIDFGTHNTVATVVRADGRRHQLLFEGNPLLPSGVYADHEGAILVGSDAARAGRRHPARYERNPKLRISSPTILLGDREIPVRDAVAAVIGRVLTECGHVAGPPRQVTVTVPAGWGPSRRHVIGDAAASIGAAGLTLLPEPVAAARYFVEVLGQELATGQAVVVFDLGAGTFDASVVARTPTGYEVLAVDGSDRIGGHYLDQALVEYLGGRYETSEERSERWRSLLDPNSGPEQQRLRLALYDEVRDAKERLSRAVTTEVVVPGFAADELLTRSELELLARPLLAQAVETTKAVLREAGREPEQLAGIFMVGGASRMPLATTMLHRELGVAPTLIEQPELVVSEGAVAMPPPPATPAAPLMPPARTPSTPAALTLPPTQVITPAGFQGGAENSPITPAGAQGVTPTQILPAAPVPEGRLRELGLILGVVALVIAVVTGGASLVYVLGDRSADDDAVSGEATGTPADQAPSASDDVTEPAENTDWDSVTVTRTEATADSITVFTDAADGLTGCSVHYIGTLRSAFLEGLDCGEIAITDLYASDTYTIELYGPGQRRDDPDAEPIAESAATETVYGEVYWDCPQTRTYCREQGGEPGIRGTVDAGDAIAYAPVGEVYELTCYDSAELITPRGDEEEGHWDYHPGKDASDLMIQIEYNGSYGYIPFVWLIIDGVGLNSTGELPRC